MIAGQAGIVSGCMVDMRKYVAWMFHGKPRDSFEAQGELRASTARYTDVEKSADRKYRELACI